MRIGRMLSAATVAVLVTLAPAPGAGAYDPGPGRFGVGHRNVSITLDDGIILSGLVSYPTTGAKAASGPFPVVLTETAYGSGLGSSVGMLGGNDFLVKHGYITALIDVRGTGASEGQWEFNEPQEALDSRQVVDWASKLANSTGSVGMTGLSYLGLTQLFAAAAVGPHSPLKAIFPMAVSGDTFREALSPGGLIDTEGVGAYVGLTAALNAANPAVQEAADPTTLASVLLDHVGGLFTFHISKIANVLLGGDHAYDDPYWRSRAPVTVLAKIVANRIPAFIVGGQYDVFQIGEPLDYAGLQNAYAHRPTTAPMNARQKVTGRYQALIGPWYHTTIGTSGGVNLQDLQLSWFDRWLKHIDTGIERTSKPLHLIDPGQRHFEAARYPLPQAPPTTLYLQPSGVLGREPTKSSSSDSIVFTGASLPCDRTTETWQLGLEQTMLTAAGLSDPCGDTDALPQSITPAQLRYETPPLMRPQVIAGPIGARLYATSTTTDTEWVLKLSDVGPDGTARDLTQGALLGSMRKLDNKRSWRSGSEEYLLPFHALRASDPQPVKPGAVTRYDIEIGPAFATLQKGHRLRLTILTGETPHLLAPPKALLKMVGGVYAVQHSPQAPSSLRIPLAGPATLNGR